MTLHRLRSSHGLLARKGGAVPLGLHEPAADDSSDDTGAGQSEDQAAGREPVRCALVSDLETIATPGATPGATSGATSGPPNEPPPPASLQPFALHRARWESGDAWELVSPGLLVEMAAAAAKDRADEAPAGDASPDSAPSSTAPAESAPEPAHKLPSDPGAPLEVAASATPAVSAPALDAAWRVGLDTLPTARGAGPWRWIGLLAAACVLVAGIAWWSFESQTPDFPEPAAPGVPGAESPPGPAAATPPGEPDSMTAPSLDLVRIEPNGDAVIAGRAAPHSELIILDNGEPIGTVKADAFGEWVFVPSSPLTQGGHEFGLVLKPEQGKVRVPAAPNDEERTSAPFPPRKPFASTREMDSGTPIPERKPNLIPNLNPNRSSSVGAPSAAFVVQLASVKTRDGARREWQKLRRRFPEVLAGMDLSLHETKLARRGTVVRVRTGPFSALDEAAEFCARIRAGQQDCLVVHADFAD